MVTPIRLTRGVVVALATIGFLVAGLLFAPAARMTWAAQMSDTFVWGKSGDADNLDNQTSSNGETSEVTTQIYNLLVRAKAGQTDIEPDLAESWSVSPDGLVWTFKLRKGVTFHDGTPWNAEAAKFNFDRMSDPKNPYHVTDKGFDFEYWGDFMADAYKEAKVVDPYTFQIVLNKPNAALVYNLSIIAFDLASPASFKKYGGVGVTQHPVGTGPYKFVDWIHGDHITLEANPTFFRKGLPKTKRVVMRVIKDNAARFLALKANEIQAMELPNPDDVKVAMRDPNLKVGYRPPFNTGWVRFNMNVDIFKEKKIRQALALAINRQAIVQGLYGGYGEVASQLMPPTMWGRTDVKPYPYDPDQAKKLLAEAKYPNGFSLDFWYIPVSRPYFPAGKEIGTAIASDLGKVGIRVHLMTEDWATYLSDRNKTNKFPIFMIGWIGDNGDPDDWLGYFYAKYDPNSAYYSYNNPSVLSWLVKARTLNSKAERAKIYAQVAQAAYDDYRDVPIASAKVPILMRKNVQGLVGQPDANEYMETVEVK